MEQLPLWFLLLSLLLPRVALLIGYFWADVGPVIRTLGSPSWPLLVLGVGIPRALILILIFTDRGWSWWLLPHASAMCIAYIAAGKGQRDARRGRRVDD